MSPLRVFFIVALAIAAVMSEDAAAPKEKRQAYLGVPYAGAYYPGIRAYAPAALPAISAYAAAVPYYGHDDGSYFPGKYPGTGLGYTGYNPYYY